MTGLPHLTLPVLDTPSRMGLRITGPWSRKSAWRRRRFTVGALFYTLPCLALIFYSGLSA
jgi:hypothetical protein